MKKQWIAFMALLLAGVIFSSTVLAKTITIQPGDTLSVLARVYATTISKLQQINGISNPDRIIAGETLLVPDEELDEEITYWVHRIKNQDRSPITEEELPYIPDAAWVEVGPQIIRFTDQSPEALGGAEPNVVRTITCRGQECDQYVTDMEALGFSVVSRYRTTLQSSMTSSQTTIPVSSITTFDGHVLTMADLGSVVYLTVEPGTVREEIIPCTTIASSQWASCTRGLAFYGTSTVSVAANQKAHNAGSIVIMSNVHYVYENLVDKDSNETVTGTKKFMSLPELVTYIAPTTDAQLAPKKYVDDTAFAGAPDASLTQKGVVEQATAQEVASSTIAGGTTAPLFIGTNLTSSSPFGLTRGIIPATEPDGRLSHTFIDEYDIYNWQELHTFFSKATFASTSIFSVSSTLYRFGNEAGSLAASNTYTSQIEPGTGSYIYGMRVTFNARTTSTASSTLNINNYGAKEIIRGARPIGYGDILPGINEAIYDGTNFQLVTYNGGFQTLGFTAPPASAATTTAGTPMNANTTIWLGAVNVPNAIVLGKFSIDITAVNVAGRYRLGLWTQDGKTLVAATTTQSISAVGTYTFQVATSTAIIPGVYYFGVAPIDTAAAVVSSWGTSVGAFSRLNALGSLSPFSATLTVAANVFPNSFNTSSLSASNDAGAIVRFDSK